MDVKVGDSYVLDNTVCTVHGIDCPRLLLKLEPGTCPVGSVLDKPVCSTIYGDEAPPVFIDCAHGRPIGRRQDSTCLEFDGDWISAGATALGHKKLLTCGACKRPAQMHDSAGCNGFPHAPVCCIIEVCYVLRTTARGASTCAILSNVDVICSC